MKCAFYLRRSDADKLAHLKASAGDAAHVAWNTDDAKTNRILKILTLLGNRFGSTRQPIKQRMKFRRVFVEKATVFFHSMRTFDD